MNQPARAFCLLVGASLPLGLLALPWHESYSVRAAAAIVVTAMALWISEIAPLGVIGLLIPIAANALGLLTWKSALEAWGDPIIFQFLGAFLLARALEKHAIFEGLARLLVARSSSRSGTSSLVLLILVVAGAISSVQNNTAVAAMLLPVVIVIARRVPTPAIPLLALAYGATFGGLATPVGTAPNFIGYAAVQTLDPSFGFLSWMRVGVPAWLGTTLIGWMVLQVTRGRTASGASAGASERQSAGELASGGAATEGVVAADRPACRLSQRWTIALFALTALIWLGQGALVSILPAEHAAVVWMRRYLPESLIPIAAGIIAFLVRPRGKPLLDRADFQKLDWDTLFLIAGGLCLGRVLESSGAAREAALAVAALQLPGWGAMLLIAITTVLLSEITSNTATAGLMVPIASSLATTIGVSPTECILLVALSASLGFALPVSTPPNAIVYGTGLVPLRRMLRTGLLVDGLGAIWVCACVVFFA